MALYFLDHNILPSLRGNYIIFFYLDIWTFVYYVYVYVQYILWTFWT